MHACLDQVDNEKENHWWGRIIPFICLWIKVKINITCAFCNIILFSPQTYLRTSFILLFLSSLYTSACNLRWLAEVTELVSAKDSIHHKWKFMILSPFDTFQFHNSTFHLTWTTQPWIQLSLDNIQNSSNTSKVTMQICYLLWQGNLTQQHSDSKWGRKQKTVGSHLCLKSSPVK